MRPENVRCISARSLASGHKAERTVCHKLTTKPMFENVEEAMLSIYGGPPLDVCPECIEVVIDMLHLAAWEKPCDE